MLSCFRSNLFSRPAKKRERETCILKRTALCSPWKSQSLCIPWKSQCIPWESQCFWLMDNIVDSLPQLFLQEKPRQNLFIDLKQQRHPIIIHKNLTNWTILLLNGMLHQYDVYFITSWGYSSEVQPGEKKWNFLSTSRKHLRALKSSQADEGETDAWGGFVRTYSDKEKEQRKGECVWQDQEGTLIS